MWGRRRCVRAVSRCATYCGCADGRAVLTPPSSQTAWWPTTLRGAITRKQRLRPPSGFSPSAPIALSASYHRAPPKRAAGLHRDRHAAHRRPLVSWPGCHCGSCPCRASNRCLLRVSHVPSIPSGWRFGQTVDIDLRHDDQPVHGRVRTTELGLLTISVPCRSEPRLGASTLRRDSQIACSEAEYDRIRILARRPSPVADVWLVCARSGSVQTDRTTGPAHVAARRARLDHAGVSGHVLGTACDARVLHAPLHSVRAGQAGRHPASSTTRATVQTAPSEIRGSHPVSSLCRIRLIVLQHNTFRRDRRSALDRGDAGAPERALRRQSSEIDLGYSWIAPASS
jgi:hypothetical protein